MKPKLRLLGSVMLLLLTHLAFGQPMSGTYTIGPAATYFPAQRNFLNITRALDTLQARGVNGAVLLEVKSDYATENVTIEVDSIPGTSATNTVTLRPQAGAGVINILNSSTVFRFKGVDFFTIDGRPGGTGTARNFFLRSTFGGAPVIHTHVGDATNITIRNCVLLANNTNFTNGMINMEPFSVAVGHDNWTITNNEILGNGDNGSGTNIGSNVGVYVTGSPNAWSVNNNLVITNNIFKDFFSPANAINPHFPISLASNTNGVTISGNAIFYTITPTFTFTSASSAVSAIRIGSTNISNVTIENNVIGGSNATGGGTAATLRGKFIFRGIDAFVPGNDTIRILNNRIVNLDLSHDTGAAGSSMFIGINVSGNGNAKVIGNTIGSNTTTGNILINNNTTTISGALVVGINVADTSSIEVRDNIIGGMNLSATNDNLAFNVYPINYSGVTRGAYVNITNNVIGSATVANSINITCGVNNSGQFNFRGINAATGLTTSVLGVPYPSTLKNANITSNTIANIRFNPSVASTGASINGIYANPQNDSTAYNISDNNIYNIAGPSDRTNTSTSVALSGITLFNSFATAGATTTPIISGNKIYGLVNTSTTAASFTSAPTTVGIMLTNSTSTNTRSVCEGNLIQGLSTNLTGTGTTQPLVAGIQNNSVSLLAINNVIRLGLDTTGAAITRSIDFRGFFKAVAQSNNFSHNTVYIAGSGVADGTNSASACYFRTVSSAGDTIANNVFVNKRSNLNTVGGGRHYAIRLNATLLGYIGYNMYYANGTGGFVGTMNGGTDNQANIAAWRTALPADNFSGYGDVSFVLANGTSSTMNLIPSSSVNLFSAPLPNITVDYRSVTRAAIPTIGAYELLTKPGVWKADAATTSWTTGTNWVSGTVPSPTGGVSIFIPENTVNVPVVSTTVTVGRFVNATTQPIVVNSGVTLTLRGELIQHATPGVLNATNATLRFAGTEPQSIGGIVNVNNLQVDNVAGVGISSGVVNLFGRYTPINGALTANGRLLFVSNANGTASVATGLGTISGNVITQRFVPAKAARKSIFVGSPVTARIDTSWQRQIHITGAIGSCPAISSNGFDVTLTGNPSMFTYNDANPSGQRWVKINNTNLTSLTPTSGYRLLVRGNRSAGCTLLDGSAQAATAVTLQAIGVLAQGDIAEGLVEGFNFIANPYQSPINFDNVASDNSTNIDASYWTYNPENNNGVFSVYNGGVLTNKPAGYTNDNIIATGQAFFVRKSTAGGANVTNFFRESHKSTTAQPGLFRTQHWLGLTRIALRANDDAHIDEAVVRFGNQQGVSNTAEGTYDALNISEGTEGISSQKAGNRYSIQTRTAVTTADTVSLHVVSNNNGSYKLYFSELQIGSNNAILIDKFSNQQQAISEGDSYSFTTTNDPASKGNRFDIVFRSSATLPTNFTAIYAKAKQDNKAAEVIWTVGSDKQVVSYTVERSTDGRNYKAVGSVASQQSNQAVSYSYTDNQAISTVVYYRVKATAADGSYKYSAVAKLNGKTSSIELSLYPNPVQSQLSVQLSQPVKGQLAARVIDSKGQVVYQQSGINLAGSNLLQLSVAHLPQGTYQLTLTNGSDFTATGSFVK